MPVKWDRPRFVLAFCAVWLPLMLLQPADQCDDLGCGGCGSCGSTSWSCEPSTEPPGQCQGTIYVKAATVTRVDPAPAATYQVDKSQDWMPPWRAEVTDGGHAEIYVRSPDDSLLITLRVYDNGGVQFERKNGTWDALMMSGGIYVVKKGDSKACDLMKRALGVSITETTTEYFVVVRPEVDEVQVSVLEGSLRLTTLDGEVLELHAETAPSMLIQNGQFLVEPFFLPDPPDKILQYLEDGRDLFGYPQTNEPPAIERQDRGEQEWLIPRSGEPIPHEPRGTEELFSYPPGGYLERALAREFAGTEVTVDGPFTNPDDIRFAESVAAFEEATGITVNYIGDKQFEARITISVEAGDAPDIADFPQPGAVATFARWGAIIDPTTWMPEDWLAQQYNQSWLDMAMVPDADGNLMSGGVWHRFNGKSLVWYPKDDWDAAGYEIPESWDELLALADRIADDGDTAWCIGIGSEAATGWPATDWTEEMMLRTTSLDNYDAWVAGELPFDSPEVKTAIETWSEIWFNPDYVYGGTEGIVSTYFGDAPAPMFEDPPRCWMHKQGNFITGFFPEGAEAGVDYDFFYLPSVDEAYGKPFLVAGDMMSMFNDRPEVRALMEYFTTPQSASGWLRNGGALAAHLTATPDLYGVDLERGIAELVAEATSFRFDGSDLMPAEVGSGSFWTGMVDYVSGTADLDTVLKEIDASWPWE